MLCWCFLNFLIQFQHYDAIMKYVSQGPLFVDVHMHRPHTTSRHFMDSLLAFWPGLQVGNICPAEFNNVPCTVLFNNQYICIGEFYTLFTYSDKGSVKQKNLA